TAGRRGPAGDRLPAAAEPPRLGPARRRASPVSAWHRRLQGGVAALMLAAGLWFVGGAAWIHAEALLAHALIEHAWVGNLASGSPEQGWWPWADTTPVARLAFVAQRRSMIVLAGASGPVLAFGPGHRAGSALPGSRGNSVISAHR